MQAIIDGGPASSPSGNRSKPAVRSNATPSMRSTQGISKNAPDASTHTLEDESSRALTKIVNLVNVSDRSEKTIRTRLQNAGFSQDAIESSIQKATAFGFINDSRFADILIRSRISQGKGSAGIERELKDNGIDPANVDGWPYEYDVDDSEEVSRAIALLQKKPPRAKNKRDAAYRKLMQKGFPARVCATAARMWYEDQQKLAETELRPW